MIINQIYSAYYSATYTTRKIIQTLTAELTDNATELDITEQKQSHTFGPDDLLIVGAPVYSGRIPKDAAENLGNFCGNNTPAIIVCVYGNRDYDDALLELKDLLSKNGFKIFAAAAFIAQHSIFPKVATSRPDTNDIIQIRNFASLIQKKILSAEKTEIIQDGQIKGNHPYKVPKEIPLRPKATRSCDKCGKCMRLCPVQAISKENIKNCDKSKCIICGRCISVCPRNARHFHGILYKIASYKFNKTYSTRKEPEFILPD